MKTMIAICVEMAGAPSFSPLELASSECAGQRSVPAKSCQGRVAVMDQQAAV